MDSGSLNGPELSRAALGGTCRALSPNCRSVSVPRLWGGGTPKEPGLRRSGGWSSGSIYAVCHSSLGVLFTVVFGSGRMCFYGGLMTMILNSFGVLRTLGQEKIQGGWLNCRFAERIVPKVHLVVS